MLSPELKSKIDQLWDKFWSRGITNPITAIEQISYLLFMRRLDEIDRRKLTEAKFTEEKYVSIFKDNEALRWKEFSQITDPDEMLRVVRDKVFPFIKDINKKKQKEENEESDTEAESLEVQEPQEVVDEIHPYTRHMENAVFLIANANLLDEAVKSIDQIYSEIKKQQEEGQDFQDTQGDIYEYLLSELKEAGKNGQFRTPRHLIQLMCEIIDPDITDKICDPACGTGGFLLAAYQHILTKYTSEKFLKTDENGFKRGTTGDKITNKDLWEKLKERTFYGFDIDQTMVRIGLMNLMLHDISIPRIEHRDTLSNKYDEYEADEQYSIVLANPPFTGRIDKGAKSKKLRINGTQSELLFLDRI
ncbi:MAG: SAM-dependent DNA methyltransferase, partial [Bacteroidetes bacterium]|nr:SAM-dependent DNA methyltransferase [Bacteroidota bacterium]